ncbi:Solute carrier organic anion transporter member 5A1 [Sparganum proliferum]
MSSNASLIDWDKNVVDFVYSCLHPDPRKFSLSQNYEPYFEKAHRRIVSATTTQAPAFPESTFNSNYYTSRPETGVLGHKRGPSSHLSKIGRFRGHKRNISDPTSGRQFLRYSFTADTRTSNVLPALSPASLPQVEDGNLPTHKALVDVTGPAYPPKGSADEASQGSSQPSTSSLDSSSTCLCPSLQFCANPAILLTALCAMVFVQSMVISGYLSSIITTLERRFDLTSRQVGYLYSSLEVTAVISTAGFSFLDGRKHNRPRIIGICGFILGLGFALFALPHWLSGAYKPTANPSDMEKSALCDRRFSLSDLLVNGSLPPAFSSQRLCAESEITLKFGDNSISTDYTVALPLFCLAMSLVGLGTSPLHVLAPTFLWDNLSERQYPLYSGLFYSAAALGPACGFIAGAAFLQVYIDHPTRPPSSLTTYSPAWLGAWWMGMLLFGGLAFITSSPAVAFPRRLPVAPCTPPLESSTETTLASTPTSESEKLPPSTYCMPMEEAEICFPAAIPESETLSPCTDMQSVEDFLSSESRLHRRQSSRLSSKLNGFQQPTTAQKTSIANKERKSFILLGTLFNHIRGLTAIFWRVVTNPVWLGATITTVTEQTIVSAFLTFAAKYIQALFRVPAHIASIHTGAAVVPSAVLGVLTGALLMRHYRPNIPKALLAVLASMVATLTTSLVLMLALSCPSNLMAGVTATYGGEKWQSTSLFGSAPPANLSAACNLVCATSGTGSQPVQGLFSCPLSVDYNPVCWQRQQSTPTAVPPPLSAPNQMTFFNPCLAGCSRWHSSVNPDGQTVETYSGCNCVSNVSLTPRGADQAFVAGGGGSVTKGPCRPECKHYAAFLVVIFLHIFLTGINQNPSNVITLSCVPPEDGTVALGLQLFFTRTFAYIPAPIIFGMLLDNVCQVRATPRDSNICQSSGTKNLKLSSLVAIKGACLEYNVHTLPYAWVGGVVFFKLISIVSVYCTWRVSKRLQSLRSANATSDAPSVPLRTSDVQKVAGVTGDTEAVA